MKGYVRGPDLKKRMHRGMKSIKQRERETGLYCPNCLTLVETCSSLMPNKSVGDKTKEASVNTYFCENCMKVYVRSRVLTFDEMVSVKFTRVKNR